MGRKGKGRKGKGEGGKGEIIITNYPLPITHALCPMPYAHSLKEWDELKFLFLTQNLALRTQHSALITHYLEVYISLPIELM